MSCIFCGIAKGEIPAEIVWRGEKALAFLDISPLFHGHVLLVPTRHVVTMPELPAEEVGDFFRAGQMLVRAVEKAMDAQGSFLAINNVISQTVPHLHLHVVPRRKGDGLKGFFWPRHRYQTEIEMKQTAAKIRNVLAGLVLETT